MKEGNNNQFASPVFKKRFARRKTTQRPFTFARNFETEESLSGAKSPVVSQVGDRGVVITSPLRLHGSHEGLTISDIVRQSPVPVLIAHPTPKEKQNESKSDGEDETNESEANTSLVRRSGRSRIPSEKFLSRRQHPHGTPQLAQSQQYTQDKSYIGSKNTSNIDAEISIVDDDGQSRGGRKTISASSSKSSKQTAKTQPVQKSAASPPSARGKAQTHDTSQADGSRPSAKDASTKKGSSRRATSASAKTSTSRKGRGRTVMERTPSPPPPAQKAKRNLSDKAKKVAPSPLSKRNKDENIMNSSKSQKSLTKTKLPSPSLPPKGSRAGSISASGRTSRKASAKRTPQSLAGKEKSESVKMTSVDKTLPHDKNTSSSSENEDQVSFQGDSDHSVSRSTKDKSYSQGSEQEVLPQREKENRPLQKDKDANSSSPSVQKKQNKTADPSSKKEPRQILNRSKKDRSHSELQTSSSSLNRTTQSQEENRTASSPTKKRKTSVADESVCLNVSVRLPIIMEDERRDEPNNSSGNGNRLGVHVRGKSGKESEPTKISTAGRRKKKIPLDEENCGTSGPSPEKRARNSQLQKPEAEDQSQRQAGYSLSSSSSAQSRREKPSVPTTYDTQSTKKKTRQSSQSKHPSQTSSVANSRVSDGGLRTHISMSRTKNIAPQTSVPSSSPKPVTSSAHKSPRKTAASKIFGKRSSPRASTSSNSFWKSSHRQDSSPRLKRQQPALSQSSLYEERSFGGKEVNSSLAVSRQVPGKRAPSTTITEHRKSERSEVEEEPKRPRSVVTELGVIINVLEDTEDDIMEDSAMPDVCQRAVHRAFTFTKRQLQETESQLKQISEVEYQINKLKTTCKVMSSESKEKLQQKFILQKELQSLKSQGIDADMMHIDQWLQDFQALRLCNK